LLRFALTFEADTVRLPQVHCPSCGTDWPDSASFCGRCGSQLAADEAEHRPLAPDRESPPWRRLRLVAAAAVVVVLGALAAAGWREHFPSQVFGSAAPPALAWSAARAPLPADSVQTSGQDAAVVDVSCPGAGNCVAVGYYAASAGSTTTSNGLIETLADGTWTPVAAPLDLAGAGAVSFVGLAAVACSSRTACVAVGYYVGQQNVAVPLSESLSGTSWTPGAPALPGDAGQGKPAVLSGVACPAPGRCVATGWYTGKNGDTQGLIDTLSQGRWTAASAPLPPGAVPRPLSSSTLPAGVFEVRCPAVGYCVAGGDYIGKDGGIQGLIDTLSGGTWTAVRAPLPGDASASNPAAYVWAITCQGVGNCVATGHYNSQRGQSRDLIESLSGSTWIAAAAPLPANAAADQLWNPAQVTGLTAVACQAAGTCEAEGSYIARGGAVDGEIDTLSGGRRTAVTAALPAGAAVAGQFAFFDAATCPTPRSCVAVGGYKTANGATAGLIETAAPESG
jgi:hypothetical protein